MDDVKIYGLCLERLKHQIRLARMRTEPGFSGKILLESYLTSDTEEIIDILELYDVEAATWDHIAEKLSELSYTASLLLMEKVEFGSDHQGNLGIFLVEESIIPETAGETVAAGAHG